MKRYAYIVSVLILFFGCVADEPLEDGLVEGIGKFSQAVVAIDESGTGQVDFTYKYLIGVSDSEGIEGFEWTYRLINPERKVFGESQQSMREPEPDKTMIYVQGSKPRVLEVSIPEDDIDGPLVLWVTVTYRETIVSEVFLELFLNQQHTDETPLPKLTRFAQGG